MIVKEAKLVSIESDEADFVLVLSLVVDMALGVQQVGVAALDEPDELFDLVLISKTLVVELAQDLSFLEVNLLSYLFKILGQFMFH